MTVKKTTLLSFNNQDWKRDKIETEKVNKLSQNIPTGNITEPNGLIYVGEKLVCD